jgi:hypothetical protein
MKRLNSVFLLGLLCLATSQLGSAAIFSVLAGSDYFTTQAGTTFMGVAFNGVPTGPGGSDTIVERQGAVNLGTGGPSSGSTSLLITQLEMVSAVPTDFGLGVGLYYITLQSARGGPATTGSMTINLAAGDDHTSAVPEGTFTSFFDVFFDIRFGAANGPIALSSDLTLTNSGASWDANPTATDVLVPGVVGDVTANLHINKVQNVDLNQMDFFPVGTVTEAHPGQGAHVVTTTQTQTSTPEPGTMVLLGGALLALSRLRAARGKAN